MIQCDCKSEGGWFYLTKCNVKIWFKGGSHNLGRLSSYIGVSAEEKIIHAFLSEGVQAFQGLVHDFLLVLQSTDCTYLVRDRFGVQSLYYKFGQQKVIFSDNLRKLINGESPSFYAISSYIDFSSKSEWKSSKETFLNNIYQVPPSTFIKIYKVGEDVVCPYYGPSPEIFNPTEAPTKFLDKFKRSLSNCTHGFSTFGSHLSGGLDSTAVTLGLSKILKKDVKCYFFDIGDVRNCDLHYATDISISERLKFNVLPIKISELFESEKLVCTLTGFPEIFVLPSIVHMQLGERIARDNVDVFLTGIDGDSVVGHGLNYLNNLKEHGDWNKYFDQYFNLYFDVSYNRGGSSSFYKNLLKREISESVKRQQWKRMYQLFLFAKNKWGYVPLGFVNQLFDGFYRKIIKIINGYSNESLVRFGRDFLIEEPDLFDFSDEEILRNFKAVVNSEYPYLFDQLNVLGNLFNFKYKHPFFDKELFELCLGVPDEVRFGSGKTRWLLRKALSEYYPNSILERRTKDDYTLFLYKSCLALWGDNRDFFLGNDRLWYYIDKKRFLNKVKYLELLPSSDRQVGILSRKLIRVLYLGIWLDTIQ